MPVTHGAGIIEGQTPLDSRFACGKSCLVVSYLAGLLLILWLDDGKSIDSKATPKKI